MAAITSETTIVCADGTPLQALLFEASEPIGVTALLAPAMLVRRRFYRSVAQQLADAGIDAITWAHRGVGVSMQGRDVRLRDWAEQDDPAVIRWARARRPNDRLFAIGHSMGGQIIALSDAVHDLDGIVTVAATEAWWGNWPRPARYAILAWYGAALPVLGRLLDPFPAGRAGLGPDTRAELVRDWARWGRHRGYFAHPRFGLRSRAGDYEGRVLAWSFADDPFLGHRGAVEALHRDYRRLEHIHHDPRPERVGHFGFYRSVGRPLVERTIDWMQRG